jgi:hypothetical protein
VVFIENITKTTEAVLKPADLEAIERFVYRNGDDMAMAISRSFERLEERMDAIESRIFSRLSEIETELRDDMKSVRLLVTDKSEVVIGKK